MNLSTMTTDQDATTTVTVAISPSTPTTRYVAYYRVSTQKQGQSGLGLKAQQAGIHGHCADRLIGEFVEVESGGNKSRKELARAVALCKKHNAILITFRLDRLLRSLDILVSLRQNKVIFTALDCLNDSEMIVNIKASFAEEELKKVSERTKNALSQKKDRGFKLGKPENLTASARAMGTAALQLKAANNENNRRASSLIELMYKDGKSFYRIAAALNRAGFQTAWGGQFQGVQVKRLIERQAVQQAETVA